jgi:hypothetical protein
VGGEVLTVEAAGGNAGSTGAPDRPPTAPARARAGRGSAGDEVLLALELVALAAFAVARPVLDSFGRSPESLVVRGVTGWWMVSFGLIVVLVPGLVVAAVGTGARRVAGPRRDWVQPVLVGLVGGLGAWRVAQDLTDRPGDVPAVVATAVVAAVALAVLRRRVPPVATFLRWAGVACAVYLVQFLALSPAAELLTPDTEALDPELVAAVGAQLGDDPPDVVLLVFDALPLASLLDGEGHIDGELYPHFAALAADGTWYPNNTTVASFTPVAVPALLTGRVPDEADQSLVERDGRVVVQGDDANLFTLLGGNYDVQAHEQVTEVCGEAVCPRRRPAALGALLGDAVDLWTEGPAPDGDDAFILPLPPGFADAEQVLDDVALAPGDQPHLVFHHVMLPHDPWEVTEDGTPYEAAEAATGHHLEGWTRSGAAVGLQRHLLQVQAADRVLGEYLDRLRAAGTYDDTLVVVTADHGMAFLPGEPSRGVSAANYAQVMWTPLIVKAPGDAGGRVDLRDVRSVDLVPTIAAALGVEVPWAVDGVAIGEPTGRDGATKPVADHALNVLHPAAGERYVEVDAAAGLRDVLASDQVEGSGPDAVWKRTPHGDLFGRAVDDLAVGETAEGVVRIDGAGRFADVARDAPLPLEAVGSTDLPEGTYLAYALNGTVAAVTEVEPALEGADGALAHALLHPRLFVDGRNELTAYVISGVPGDEVLRPLVVEGTDG